MNYQSINCLSPSSGDGEGLQQYGCVRKKRKKWLSTIMQMCGRREGETSRRKGMKDQGGGESGIKQPLDMRKSREEKGGGGKLGGVWGERDRREENRRGLGFSGSEGLFVSAEPLFWLVIEYNQSIISYGRKLLFYWGRA